MTSTWGSRRIIMKYVLPRHLFKSRRSVVAGFCRLCCYAGSSCLPLHLSWFIRPPTPDYYYYCCAREKTEIFKVSRRLKAGRKGRKDIETNIGLMRYAVLWGMVCWSGPRLGCTPKRKNFNLQTADMTRQQGCKHNTHQRTDERGSTREESDRARETETEIHCVST